jgi:serine protease Do
MLLFCQLIRRVLPLLLLLQFATAARAQAQTDGIASSRRTAVVRAVERVQPAVVSIHVTFRERVVYRYRDPFMDLFFPSFSLGAGERERTSGGSGVIVGSSSYVLTNDHVVSARSGTPAKITVSLPDGRSFDAEYLASDISSDLAILRVKQGGLPVASLGDSDDIQVGEWAIAIGNPFDLGTTVSLGVISAVKRDFQEPQEGYYYRDMIQTDAAINPGNSGGPLVNAVGEVIGINSFIFTGSDYSFGSIGIGFAIPINAARSFLEEIQRHGKVRRPWVGLYVQPLTGTLAEYLGLPSTDGVLVAQVEQGSPADVAGFERGDVIVAIAREPVTSAEQAIGALQAFRVDEICTLTVVRGGEKRHLSMRLKERPASRQRRN